MERNLQAINDTMLLGIVLASIFIVAIIAYFFYRSFKARIIDFFAKARYFADNTNNININIQWALMILMLCIVSADLYVCTKSSLYALCPTIFLIKLLLYAGINRVFFNKEECSKYLRAIILLNTIFLGIIPLVAFIWLFANLSLQIVQWIAIFWLFAYDCLLLYRLIVSFCISKSSYLMIIAYFCALEIAPCLMLGIYFF